MSSSTPTAHADHDHAHGHAHHHPDAHSHGTLRSYLIGFILSVILTAIPFWLVMTGRLDNKQATAIAVMGFAFVQIIVHMVYFLHMNSKSESGWTMMALIFTIVVVAISLSGSMWVMYHLNANMGTGSHSMSDAP